jgi:predicted ATPase
MIEKPEERLALARLNLKAGKKAKDAPAFDSALTYFRLGSALLPSDTFERHKIKSPFFACRRSLSAAGTQIAAMAKRNAESASTANDLMDLSMESVAKADESMGVLTESINHVSEGGEKMLNIVEMIGQIAFQPNLLALNAAIEAISHIIELKVRHTGLTIKLHFFNKLTV